VLMLIGWGVAWLFYIARPELPVELAQQHSVLYRFLLNKWYFDEIYDAIIVRPTLWLGRLLWEGGDGLPVGGLCSHPGSGAGPGRPAQGGAPPAGLHVPLCFRHAARCCGFHPLVHVWRRALVRVFRRGTLRGRAGRSSPSPCSCRSSARCSSWQCAARTLR